MSTLHTWTDEQDSIYSFALSSPENLIINALAGAAKSTTLVELVTRVFAARLYTSAIILAFNKRIADEMTEKTLPEGVVAKTMNSVGFQALRSLVPKLGKVSTTKRSVILRKTIERWDSTEEIAWLNDNYLDLLEILRLAAQSGWVPEGKYPATSSLYTDEEFYDFAEAKTDLPLQSFARAFIHRAHCEAINVVFSEGTADFDDQIFISTLWPGTFPRYQLVLIDEAQDLSPLQHRMLKKLAGQARVIAVGDAYQAIYAFRGASEDSMRQLQKSFSMLPLTLSTSFRCPRAVAEHVRWRAPFIQSPEWAIDGSVTRLDAFGSEDIPDGATIICRNNAPLFKMALRLLLARRRPQIIGNDIIKALVRDLSSLAKDKDIPQNEALRLLDVWLERQKAKYKSAKRYDDKHACLQLFIESADTLGGAIEEAEKIERMRGSITLLTGHKAKGLEFPHVFFLDEHIIKLGGQEDNLRYVIATRAKETLTYVDSETWVGSDV